MTDRDMNWQVIEPDYRPAYVAGLRRLTGVQKLEAADMLYRTALAVKVAGLRRRHPGLARGRPPAGGRTHDHAKLRCGMKHLLPVWLQFVAAKGLDDLWQKHVLSKLADEK